MQPKFTAKLLYRIEPELRDAVAEHAERNMILKSQVVRQSLRNYLATFNGPSCFVPANSHHEANARASA